MKNKRLILIGLFLLAILFISGCKQEQAQNQEVVCNKPYILVGNDCCLDQNDNLICDNDEIEESQDSSTEQLLSQGIMVDSCDSGSIFKCESYAINQDKITLKLKSTKANYYSLKRIYLPQITLNGCELNNINTSFDNALSYEEIKIFEIPCNIDKESVGSELFIEYIYYKPTNNTYDFDVENEKGKFIVQDGSSKGYLSGMVR